MVFCLYQILKPGGLLFFRDYGLYDHAMLRFNPRNKLSDNFYVRQDGTRAYYFSKGRLQYINYRKKVNCVYLHNYRKIPKISPRAYIFQRPFLRGLFLEGLIFGGAYLWREICLSKSIGLTLWLEGNLPFLLCFALYLRAIPSTSPWGAYIWRGYLMEGFLCHEIGGLYFGGAFTWRGLFLEFYGIYFFGFLVNGQ